MRPPVSTRSRIPHPRDRGTHGGLDSGRVTRGGLGVTRRMSSSIKAPQRAGVVEERGMTTWTHLEARVGQDLGTGALADLRYAIGVLVRPDHQHRSSDKLLQFSVCKKVVWPGSAKPHGQLHVGGIAVRSSGWRIPSWSYLRRTLCPALGRRREGRLNLSAGERSARRRDVPAIGSAR